MSNSSSRRQSVKSRSQNQLISQQLTAKPLAKKVVYPVDRGLRSEASKKLYRWHFSKFVKWLEEKYNTIVVDERLVLLGGEQIQILLMDYIEYLVGRNLKHATVNAAMSSVIHFCDMNDIYVNRKKIGKCLPDRSHRKDRAYTRDEIQKLLDNSDARFKAVIALMANGMRVGAIPTIRLCDLTTISVTDNDTNEVRKIYKIDVYVGSDSEYYTFVTPECTKYIDDYLDFRKNQGEKDVSIHEDNRAPLIREQFKLNDRLQAANPRFMSQSTLEKYMERTIKKARTNTYRKVMMTHGFRKYAITMMAEANVRFTDREFLVGHRHSIGLDRQYYKPTEDKRLIEWSKAINYLTIDPGYQANIELKEIKGEMAQKVAKLEARNAKLIAEQEQTYKDFGELRTQFEGFERGIMEEFNEVTKSLREYVDSDEYKQILKLKQQLQQQQKQQQKK